MPPVVAFLARRAMFAAGTLVLTAFFAYSTIRVLRPELYGALLHLDLGRSCRSCG